MGYGFAGTETVTSAKSSSSSTMSEVGLGCGTKVVRSRIASTCLRTTLPESNTTWYESGPLDDLPGNP